MGVVALENTKRNRIHPLKFALWAGCASILMMFAAFTSAYIVRHAAGNWLEFRLPGLFFVSTAVIILSSICIQMSYYYYKKGNAALYRGTLFITAVLGITFLVLQYQGWLALKEIGVFLDGNPSGSFVYVLSGVHAAHVVGGVAALIVASLHAWLLPFKITSKRKLRLELTLTYWHFVDFLWVYLLFFFMTQ